MHPFAEEIALKCADSHTTTQVLEFTYTNAIEILFKEYQNQIFSLHS